MIGTPTGWWGYAEGNPTLVGIVAAIVLVAALAYVARRLWRRGGR